MTLQQLLHIFSQSALSAQAGDLVDATPELTSVTSDSRNVKKESGFFAIPGAAANGLNFIGQAIKNGATVCFVPQESLEEISDKFKNESCVFFGVTNIRLAYALAAQGIAGSPSGKLKTVGVTGTNGKTSVCWIISEAITLLEGSCGYLGTLGVRSMIAECRLAKTVFSEKTNTTTPDSSFLANSLHNLVEQGCKGAAIEVSSHALDQYRSAGISWNAAVITNITRDHLDYHKTFDDYAETKKLLFSRDLPQSSKGPFAVLNYDDDTIRRWIPSLEELKKFPVYTFSADPNSGTDAILEELELTTSGTTLQINISGEEIKVNSRLIGRYNALNTLAAAATLAKLGYNSQQLSTALSLVSPVPGRMQPVGTANNPVFVDYAHTPDAMQSVLNSLREIHPGKITTIFGCGGDRDKGKRPMMAKVAAELSDKVVVTSDNPRSEEPEAIIADVVVGLSGFDNYQKITDRRHAIQSAISEQQAGELILIAGKGHEDYQEIKGAKHHFLDEEVAREAIDLLQR